MKIRQIDNFQFKDEIHPDTEPNELSEPEGIKPVTPTTKSNKSNDEYDEVRQGLKRILNMVKSETHTEQNTGPKKSKVIERYQKVRNLIIKKSEEDELDTDHERIDKVA